MELSQVGVLFEHNNNNNNNRVGKKGLWNTAKNILYKVIYISTLPRKLYHNTNHIHNFIMVLVLAASITPNNNKIFAEFHSRKTSLYPTHFLDIPDYSSLFTLKSQQKTFLQAMIFWCCERADVVQQQTRLSCIKSCFLYLYFAWELSLYTVCCVSWFTFVVVYLPVVVSFYLHLWNFMCNKKGKKQATDPTDRKAACEVQVVWASLSPFALSFKKIYTYTPSPTRTHFTQVLIHYVIYNDDMILYYNYMQHAVL